MYGTGEAPLAVESLGMPRRIVALFAALAFAASVAVPAAAGSRPQRHPTRENAVQWWSQNRPEPESGGSAEPAPTPGTDPAPDAGPGTVPETPTFPVCTDDVDAAVPFQIYVNGDPRPAKGIYALPATNPVGMVVFSHGWGHSSLSWQHHAARVARTLNVIAIAMDGRDLTILETFKAPGIPNTAGWPVKTGAEDGIAAARLFEAACPTVDTVVNYGVSMGGNTSGVMAAAGAKRADGAPLFDWWVNIEGVNNLVETYLAARAASPAARDQIERETGGPFEAKQDEYFSRSNVRNVERMKAAGLKGVVLVHGVDDGLVPYNQAQEMFAALTAVDIPTQFFTVTLKSNQTERETAATGYVFNNVDKSYRSPLAGHASEMSTTHIVGVTGFERLDAIFAGQPPACTRVVVTDGQVGSTPLVGC